MFENNDSLHIDNYSPNPLWIDEQNISKWFEKNHYFYKIRN
jgi:hypothetical protein